MAWDGVLVRFGEIGIKSPPVRRGMLDRLAQNITNSMVRRGVEGSVERLGARLWLQGPDVDGLLFVATHTFGVVSASAARVSEPDMVSLQDVGVALAAGAGWDSFAVRASREGKQGFTSQEAGRDVGAAIVAAREAEGLPWRVDLANPDFEVHLDIRAERAFAFTKRLAGPGGLPMGSQGHVVCLLSDPNSAVAAWLMGRRGCRVTYVHAGTMGSVPAELVDALAHWGMPDEVHVLPVCSGATTKEVLQDAAARIMEQLGAVCLVTGDDVQSHLAPSEAVVLRPVCGMDADTLAGFATRIGVADLEGCESFLAHDTVETADSLLSMQRIVHV